MLREIMLDTETTGVDAATDRIVEIGCVELVNHVPSGRSFHAYLNPQRPVSQGAFAVHGLSDAFLADKPLFAEIGPKLLDFIEGGTLVIHNAGFDMGFLRAEYGRLGQETALAEVQVIDTLLMARRKHPGAANNLDALCLRYGIDNSRRTKHGALLDAEILAEVYIELIGGKQAAFVLAETMEASAGGATPSRKARQRSGEPPRYLSENELAAHGAFVETLGAAIWRTYLPDKKSGS